MSSQQHDGGPVFPETTKYGNSSHSAGGMTLRDYFAGQALAGLLAEGLSDDAFDDAAEDAWRYADAMLKYRPGIPIEQENST